MASPASESSRTPDNEAAASSSPAAPAAGSKPAVELTAVTTRDDFLLELGDTLGGQAAICPVETLAAALEHLATARRAQVVVLDSRDLGELRADLERLESRCADAPVLVFAPQESEKEVAASARGAHVFAVLPIPIDAAKTAAVIEGAIAEALTRKGDASAQGSSAASPRASRGMSTAAVVGSPPASALSAASGLAAGAAAGRYGDGGAAPGVPGKTVAASGPSLPRKNLLIGICVGVAVIAAASVLFLGHSGTERVAPVARPTVAIPTAPTAAPVATPQPAETLLLKGKVDDLLEKARLAMRERRYSEPAGDNALLYYRSAAAADPSNGEASDGLQRVAGVLANRFDEELGAGHLDEASVALSNFKLAAADDPRTNALEFRLLSAWISKAIADGNSERAALLIRQASQSPAISAEQVAKWRTELARHQEDLKVQRLATLITDRLRDSRLVEPADDSARSYLQQLRELAPGNPVTVRLEKELGAACMRRAREAALAGRSADLEHWLTEARGAGVTAAEISTLQREVASARVKATAAESEHLTQLVRDRLHDGRLAEPAQDSAAFYLTQLQATDAGNAAAAALGHELATRFIDRARSEAQARQSSAADADLTQARRWGADPKDLQAVQALQAAAQSAASRPQFDLATLATSLKKTRNATPDYPPRALQDRISGSVTVQFVVTTSGEPRDIHIIDSKPGGVFDHAALSAVKRWRWESPPVEVPMRTAIRFELPK